MPPVRSTAFRRHNKLMLLILSISKVMPSCSYYIKKGLLCIAIMSPFSCQPSLYNKYTTANMRLSYNIYLVSNAKYKYFTTHLNYYMPYLICLKVLDLIYY